MKHIPFYIFFSLLSIQISLAQLTVNAGADRTICYGKNTSLGGTPTATAGTAPYKYLWQPATFLNSTSIPNPVASNITTDITYTLTVTDKNETSVTDDVNLNLDKIFTYNAGLDTGYCFGQAAGVTIGAPNNGNAFHNFMWAPNTNLSNTSDPRPIANPSVTTVYRLTVSDGLCPNNVTFVTVTPFPAPIINASADTTIDEGQTITLKGISSTYTFWQPDYNIKYINTAEPDVWPITTTTYSISSQNNHGCVAYDDVTVTVINGDKLFFYSAFTPNGDGDNDFFYIGNLEKYPDNNVKIYNRYGKQIYSATNYDNLWDGKYLGNEVPTGTYFYILNDGKDKLYKGSVTILR